MAARDLGIDQVEFRRRNLVREAEMPYKVATIAPFESKDELDSGDYQVTLDRCLAEFGWAEKEKLKGKLIDGRYHGLAVCCFIEGGAAGPEGECASGAGNQRHAHRLYGLVRRRPGAGDGVRANRRRRHGHADGPHQSGVPRLDGLCQRRLRLLSLALDRDGRLGGARCRDKTAGGHERGSGAAAQLRRRRGRARRRPRRRARRQIGVMGGAGAGAAVGRRRVFQPQAHLGLRRARRPCRGRSKNRRGRAHRLCGRRELRPHDQPADAQGPAGRRRGAGPRRRVPGASRL